MLPHYRNMFSGVCGSFIMSSARGLLTGRRSVFLVSLSLYDPKALLLSVFPRLSTSSSSSSS